MKNYLITNYLAVNPAFAIKLADLNYNETSNRMDDRGALWVAPVAEVRNWNAPVGLIAIYASTNGEPILVGQIEDGELTWIDENNSDTFPKHMRFPIENAVWADLPNEDASDLRDLVRKSIPANRDDE